MRGVAPHFAEQRCRSIQRQIRQRNGADVPDRQVDLGKVPLFGQPRHLLDVVGVEQQAGKALQSAAADTDPTDPVDILAITQDKRSARTHAHHDHPVQTGNEARAQTVRHEFIRLPSGQSVDGLVDIGASSAREHDLCDVRKVDLVVMQILSECSVERGDRICGLYPDGGQNLPASQPNDLGGADSDIDSDDDSSGGVLFLVIHIVRGLRNHRMRREVPDEGAVGAIMGGI